MFVSKILQELDAELERLQTARNTIVSLITAAPARLKRTTLPKAKPPAPPPEAAPWQGAALPLKAAPLQEAAPSPDLAPEAPPEALTAPRRGRPKGSRSVRVGASRPRVSKLIEPTALGRTVSAGPVFVSAAELERHKHAVVMAAPKPPEETPPEGTLDSLVREIAARRVDTAA